MKHKHAIRRAAALALTALLGLSALWPSLSTRAGAEFDIDTSSHQAPALEDFDAYNWKPGLPPYTKENHMQNNELRRFPVLLTWKDQMGNHHYFRVNSGVARCMDENLSAVITKFHYDWWGFFDYVDLSFDGYLYDGLSYDDDHSGRRNGLFDDDGSYPDGLYMKNLCYPAGDDDNLWNESKLKLDMVDKYGKMLTLSCPNGVPDITPMVKDMTIATVGVYPPSFVELGPYISCPGYVLSINLTDSWFYNSDYAGDHYYTDGGLRKGRNLLVPFRSDRLRSDYYPLWRWSLMGMNDNTWRQANNWFFDLHSRSGSGYDYADGSAQRASGWGATDSDRDLYMGRVAFATLNYGWFAREEVAGNGEKQYSFFGYGSKAFIRENGKTQTDGDEERNMHNRPPLMQLGHNQEMFATFGEVRGTRGYDWLQTIWNGGSIWYNIVQKYNTRFNCYYAERVPVRVLKTDTRVVDGQVSELAGPVLITNNPTITVEDGGTLVVSNWVMNNGKIVVEEGGTLYISDNACLNRYEDGGDTGGGVICSGLIIVGENAKLIGGGVDGIQLKNGAHVVNYGCLASENFSCVEDHTVENRGQGFVRYGAGNAVEGSGSLTFETPLDYSGRSFADRTTRYKNPSVSIGADCIYNGD